MDKLDDDENVKLQLLCQHYDIQSSPTMFHELALALARDLYPERKKAGRKTKWTGVTKGILVIEVERLLIPDDPLHGIEWACKQLSMRDPWASFLETKGGSTFGSDPTEVLRKIYFDFRNDRLAELTRISFKDFQQQNELEIWEGFVIDWVRK